MAKPVRARDRGQALLVMMIVLVLGSLYTLAARLDGSAFKSRQAQATGAALRLAQEALIAYATTYRDTHDGEVWGYLPCPDTAGKAGLFHPGDGTAAASCGGADEVSVGLLPYRTLDLPELRDGDGNCLWYAVSGSFKNSPKPTTPLNWDAQGQLTAAVAGVVMAAPDDANGGAAAVVFAPGPALPGQSRRLLAQPCGADPGEVSAYLEDAAGNDRTSWIAPRDIFARILARADFKNPLGTFPEGRINRLIDATRQALENRLWTDMAAQTAASSGRPLAAAPAAGYATDYPQFGTKLIGDLPELKPLVDGSFEADFDQWRDQFRYAVCADLKPVAGCMSAGSRTCRGTLLFAGQARADAFPFGGPRPASQKPGTPRAGALPHYFEEGGGLDLLAGPALAIVGASSYADAARSADVAVCLSPGGYATAAKDIAAFGHVATSATLPEARIDTATAGIRLGEPAATAAGRGCAWLPIPLPFDSALHAYFRLRIADRGEGLVFAIADATANQAAMAGGGPCGGNTASRLGYAGGSLAAPKFGLEIDTRAQTGADCSGNNRNDPGADHLAFVYWGSAASTDDDNCHGAGISGDGAQPLNPRSLTGTAGIATVHASDPHLPYGGSLPLDTDIHVRLDVRKTPVSDTGIALTLRAYVATHFKVSGGSSPPPCSVAHLRNLGADLESLCRQNPTVVQDDVYVAGQALATIYAGFANAQNTSAAGRQSIGIFDFAIVSQ